MKTFEEFDWFGKKKREAKANYDPSNLADPYGEETWVDEDAEKMELVTDCLFQVRMDYLPPVAFHKIYLRLNGGYLYLGETYYQYMIVNNTRQITVFDFTVSKKLKNGKMKLEKGFFGEPFKKFGKPIDKINLSILKKRSEKINFDKLYKLITEE
jgi:hypothetical protein